MKKIVLLGVSALVAGWGSFAADFGPKVSREDFVRVAKTPHPRLILDDGDFAKIGRAIARKPNEPLGIIHQNLLGMAQNVQVTDGKFSFKPDGVKNPLAEARAFLRVAAASSYAYRQTRKSAYADSLAPLIGHYCEHFDEWMKASPIDAFIIHAEYALGLAFAYDWMHAALKPEMLAKMEGQMRRHILFCKWRESDGNNRSQVCNAAYLACAVALADRLDAAEMAEAANRRIESLRRSMALIYDQDGASNESASYWSYGINFQAIALAVLDKSFGTDFGLMDTSGFRKTLDHHLFTTDNLGGYFDYGDCNEKSTGAPGALYCAWKFNQPDNAWRELELVKKGGYKAAREAIVGLIGAYGLSTGPKPRPPKRKFYSAAGGTVPIAIARTGFGRDDAYAGIKGGSALDPHGHMDAGTFIYESFGQRWAADCFHPAYQHMRNILKQLGAEGDHTGIDHPYWSFFHVNNRQHNTLTVNGHNQVPSASARLIEVLDSGAARGATVDLTPCYALDLTKAVRSFELRDDQSFVVRDRLAAKDDGEARIRWTLCTRAEVTVDSKGIVLESGGVRMLVRTDAPDAEYRIWPSDPGAYPESPVGKLEAQGGLAPKGFHFTGFVFTLPAGASADVTTTFRRSDR